MTRVLFGEKDYQTREAFLTDLAQARFIFDTILPAAFARGIQLAFGGDKS